MGAGELARRGDHASRAAAGRVDDAQVAPSAIRELASPDAVGRRLAPVSLPGVEGDDVHWFSERGDGVVGEDIPADDFASLSAGPLGEHGEDQLVRGGRGAHDALEARGVASEVAVMEGSELDRPLHPCFGRPSAGLRASCSDREAEGLAHRVSMFRKGSDRLYNSDRLSTLSIQLSLDESRRRRPVERDGLERPRRHAQERSTRCG